MTYSPNDPQALDSGADSQPVFLTNFQQINSIYSVNHIPFGSTIENITNANPAVVTSTRHRLNSGDTITVDQIFGINASNVRVNWPINGNTYTVTVTDTNTFTIPVDTTSLVTYPTYEANTGDFEAITGNLSQRYGLHHRIYFSGLQQAPGRAEPISAIYPQQTTDTNRNGKDPNVIQTNLFFQNKIDNIYRLTGANLKSTATGNNHKARGIVTPWGQIWNFGYSSISDTAPTVTYPKPYSTTNYFTIVQVFSRNKQLFDVQVSSFDLTSFTTNLVSITGKFTIFYLSAGI